MKYIRTKIFVLAAFLVSFLSVNAQEQEDMLFAMSKDSLRNSDNTKIQVAYQKVNKSDLLGGVSYVDVANLMNKNYFSYSLENMQGYVGGWNGSSLWGMDGYEVIIDGIPRDANNVMPSEIEQITFLKSASAIALYGSRGAKGVIYITTKRGKVEDRKIRVQANTGWYVPKSYPKYMGSAEYMTLYNEARVNDGLEATYSADDIYNHASGTNPYRYPNVNMYSSDYLKKAYNYTEGVVEVTGGSEKAQFYTNINLYNEGSLLKYGDAKNDNTTRFSVRGNIDVALNNFIKSFVNANATFYDRRGALGDFWSAAASLRPNRISPLIPVSYIDQSNESAWALVNNSNHLIDGKYLLGGTQLNQTNALADLYAAGYSTYTSRQYQFDAGVDVNLARVLDGLSFKTQFGIDYSTSYSKSYNNSYATYEADWGNFNGEDVILGLTKYGTDKKSGVQNIGGSWNRQTISFSGQFDYKKVIDNTHNISAMLIASGYQRSTSGDYHKTSNANLGLQVDYNYLSKYYLSLSNALVYSARLPKGNRMAFSPSVSLGWRLTGEEFLKDHPVIDDLVLSTSASVLHSDLDISDYYLYQDNYNQTDGAWWGWADGNQNRATQSLRGQNNDLSFIKRKEISIGLRSSLWKRMLTVDFSLFSNRMEGLLTQASSLYPGYFVSGWPTSSFLPYLNYNNYDRKGFDFAVNVNKRVDEVDLGFGVSGTYYKSKNARLDETYQYSYQNRTGHPTDGVWGLVSDGFFSDDTDIANSPTQSFGEVKPGDIKYVDQNGDNVIDEKDVVYLGKRYGWQGAPFTLGVNFTAKWNNITLFVLGTGSFGASAMKNSQYYWVFGDRKYSEVVRGRWTEETKETATYPRLTTKSGDNNFRDSDFWLYSTDQFNIARVQVTYDFPKSVFNGTFVNDLSMYVSGSNLLKIAKERKILELNTGGSPQTRFFNIGLKAVF